MACVEQRATVRRATAHAEGGLKFTRLCASHPYKNFKLRALTPGPAGTSPSGDKLLPSTDQRPWCGKSVGGDVLSSDEEMRFVEAPKAGPQTSLPPLTEAINQESDW